MILIKLWWKEIKLINKKNWIIKKDIKNMIIIKYNAKIIKEHECENKTNIIKKKIIIF